MNSQKLPIYTDTSIKNKRYFSAIIFKQKLVTAMRFKIIFLLSLFFTLHLNAQTHFTLSKKISYKSVKIQTGQFKADSLKVAIADISKLPSLENLTLTFERSIDAESTTLNFLYQEKKLKSYTFDNVYWTLDDNLKVADIDGNGLLDIKLVFFNNGSGLAGSLSTKVYLFNLGNRFKVISFFDFSGEDEYDLNKDGKYEILSKNHIYLNNHSYWVYNTYNFTGEKIINVSKSYQYPLWTKHLYRTDREIAKEISYNERLKEFRVQPNEFTIR
jgi:hypothetical protein